MYHFCAYFDQNYLVRGLTMFRSLKKHTKDLVFWVLCLDGFTYDIVSKLRLPELRPISMDEFEHGDEPLKSAKSSRNRIEYYFTCTPSWLLYLLTHFPEIDLITYLDADLFFYSSPGSIYDEVKDQSILLVGHRFPEHLKKQEKAGIYNVGWLSFRNDIYGMTCLRWWRERCLEWCHNYEDHGRYADQKYLDDWPERFQRVAVLQHQGAGVAPWNWMNDPVCIQNGLATVNGRPLVFYHFHRLKIINRFFSDPSLVYGKMPASLRRWFYGAYIRELKNTWQWLKRTDPSVGLGTVGAALSGSSSGGLRLLASSLKRGELVVTMGPVIF